MTCTPWNTTTNAATPAPAMDTMTTTSPPQDPVVLDQTVTVPSNQCSTINVLNGATVLGDTLNYSSLTVEPPGASHGTTTVQSTSSSADVYYCNNGDSSSTDSFTFEIQNTTGTSAADPTSDGWSNVGTVSINVSFNECDAGAGNASGSTGALSSCSLRQLILLPVQSGEIVLSQYNGLPVDGLITGACPGGNPDFQGLQLNGQEQMACGELSPLTITNATGLDAGWTLQAQTTDFVDPADPGLSCDSNTSYSNHCIPGGNLGMQPASAVSHDIVPGDTAQVSNGATVLPPIPSDPSNTSNPLLSNATIGGGAVQANPVLEPNPNAGLDQAPATICYTGSGASGGTFICGAGLALAVPASIAEPIAPGYEATLTLTLF